MTEPKLPTYRDGQRILYLQIEPDGTETVRAGEVFAVAPAVPGVGRAYWVTPRYLVRVYGVRGAHLLTVQTALPPAGPLLVAVASKRLQVGGLYRRGGFFVKAGRFVDRGTHYTEVHEQGKVNGTRAMHAAARALRRTSIAGQARTVSAQTDLDNFVRTIAALS